MKMLAILNEKSQTKFTKLGHSSERLGRSLAELRPEFLLEERQTNRQ